MAAINEFLNTVSNVLWGLPMVVLLFGTHLFLTIRTKGIQRKTGLAIRLSLKKDPDAPGQLSPFQTLSTMLASTIGTGNIIGVGTAIFLGGPGAVFWCWLAGVFGIATTYGESLIAVKYRVKTPDGRMQGGAMYVLDRRLHMKWLGILFALFAAIAAFGIGCGTQVNAIAEVLETNLPQFNLSRPLLGIVFAVLVGAVILGGIKSIGKICEKLVPFMAGFYILGCLVILGMNYDYILPALSSILELAFRPGAVAGGLVGQGLMTAARYGIARGLFTNEAGMGSAPLVASAAQARNPVRLALVSSTGTFWDTVVICLITGVTLVSTIMKNPELNLQAFENGGQMTTAAFQQIPVIGPAILIIGIVTFAFATTVGWSYYGERAAEYLFGKKGIIPYKMLFLTMIAVGPIITLDAVWTLSDILNALMAIPNLFAVLCLSGEISRDTKHYLKNLDEKDLTPIPVVDTQRRPSKRER